MERESSRHDRAVEPDDEARWRAEPAELIQRHAETLRRLRLAPEREPVVRFRVGPGR